VDHEGKTSDDLILSRWVMDFQRDELAAVTELTPPFLVISEPSNLLDTPALEKFSDVPQGASTTLAVFV
jgi:hypothetical protein